MAKKLNKFRPHFGWNTNWTIVFIKPNCSGLCFQNRLWATHSQIYVKVSRQGFQNTWTKIAGITINRPLGLAAWKLSVQSKGGQLRSQRLSPLQQTCHHSVCLQTITYMSKYTKYKYKNITARRVSNQTVSLQDYSTEMYFQVLLSLTHCINNFYLLQ